MTSRQRFCILAFGYAIYSKITNILQSEEEEDELVKDEDATQHDIVKNNIKKQGGGMGV